jgi:hypothetical protein
MPDADRKLRYQRVRAGINMDGTTLIAWCRTNGTHMRGIRDADFGTWNGSGAAR